MTNRTVLELRTSELERLLHELRSLGPISLELLEQDAKLRGAVEWYLFSATQLAIEIGETIIAWKQFRRPSTYRETFDILAEQSIIKPALANRLVRMTGLRNVLAHMYRKIDLNIVADAVHHRLVDLDQFIETVKSLA